MTNSRPSSPSTSRSTSARRIPPGWSLALAGHAVPRDTGRSLPASAACRCPGTRAGTRRRAPRAAGSPSALKSTSAHLLLSSTSTHIDRGADRHAAGVIDGDRVLQQRRPEWLLLVRRRGAAVPPAVRRPPPGGHRRDRGARSDRSRGRTARPLLGARDLQLPVAHDRHPVLPIAEEQALMRTIAFAPVM